MRSGISAISRHSGGATRANRRANRRLELRPLPWPTTGMTAGAARKPHAHRCFNCSAVYACPGPDGTGLCTPVCSPCYWVELGVQLRRYQAMVASLIGKRARLERRAGSRACRQAQRQRRELLRQADLLTGFGGLAMRSDDGVKGDQIETSNGVYGAHPAG